VNFCGRKIRLFAAFALLAPTQIPPAASASGGDPDPVEISASVSPQTIRVGTRATIEIAVVTPPRHRLLPFTPPPELRDLEIENSEILPDREIGDRFLHTLRIRFRPRDTGDLVWPETELAIEDPDGAILRRAVEPIPFAVKSVLSLYPGRTDPFGVRPAPPPPGAEEFSLAPVAIGLFVCAAAALALVLLKRSVAARRRRTPAPADATPWALALTDLRGVSESEDPAAAATTTAAALRRYMELRFGASTRAKTAEELVASQPPFGATSRWSTFTALLLELDSIRFAPRTALGSPSRTMSRVSELLDRSRRFVETSMPPEALR